MSWETCFCDAQSSLGTSYSTVNSMRGYIRWDAKSPPPAFRRSACAWSVRATCVGRERTSGVRMGGRAREAGERSNYVTSFTASELSECCLRLVQSSKQHRDNRQSEGCAGPPREYGCNPRSKVFRQTFHICSPNLRRLLPIATWADAHNRAHPALARSVGNTEQRNAIADPVGRRMSPKVSRE